MTEDENIELIIEDIVEDAIEEVVAEAEAEEEDLDEIIVTEEDENIELIEDATESIMEEVVIEVDVEEEEPVEIIVTEAADPTGVRITSDHSPYLPDQHTVGAITGLTERLEKLERFEHPDTVPLPEPVEAVETNQANYYLWDDENPHAENRDGYFVSIHQKQDVNKIYICNSLEDEFGVTVSAAGFIGNQSTNKRGSNYGLVVHSGVVAVKCESDVGVGDYVVSNKNGKAKKTDGTYGYYVNSISETSGDRCAIISFIANSKPLKKVSKIVQDVAGRMENAEENIFANRGVANEAHAMAEDALKRVSHNNVQVNDKIGEIIDKVDSTVGRVDDLEIGVGQAQNSATNAESIAISLGNQAVNASAEAIVQANAALLEAQNARDEIYGVRDEVEAEAEKAQSQAKKAQEDISELVRKMEPLSQWTDGVNKGVSGFVTRSDENSTQLALISDWQTITTESIAGVKTQAEENSAKVESLASYIDKSCEVVDYWSETYEDDRDDTQVYYARDTGFYWYWDAGIEDWKSSETPSGAGLPESLSYSKQLADKNKAAIEETASYSKDLSVSIATVEKTADDNAAEIKNIVSRESETAKTIAGIIDRVDDNEAEITNITSYVDRTSVVGLERWPDDISVLNRQKIYFVDKYKTDDGTEIPAYYYYYQNNAWRTTTDPADAGLIASIANVTQKANKNEASIQSLTEWQGETNGSIATLTQRADENGAIIEGLVSNVNKYSVGEDSPAHGLTIDEAKKILKNGTVFIPTDNHTEKYSDNYTQEFTKGFFYTWNGVKWVGSDSSGDVVFSDDYINGSTRTPYWVVGDAYAGSDYKVGALYEWEIDEENNGKWIEKMTRESNMLARSTSLLQQKANEITLSVTDVKGRVAALEANVDEDGASTAMMASVVTQFKDASGNPVQITGTPHEKVEGITNAEVGKYYAVGSEAPYDVYTIRNDALTKVDYLYYDGIDIKKPNTASIIAAANEDTTNITLNANKLNFNGYATFTDDGSGLTGISGDLIHTGTIRSNDKSVYIDLSNNTVAISGQITATSGYIGKDKDGFSINENTNYVTLTLDGISSNIIYYIQKDGWYYYFISSEDLIGDCNVIMHMDKDNMLTEVINNSKKYYFGSIKVDELPDLPCVNIVDPPKYDGSYGNIKYNIYIIDPSVELARNNGYYFKFGTSKYYYFTYYSDNTSSVPCMVTYTPAGGTEVPYIIFTSDTLSRDLIFSSTAPSGATQVSLIKLDTAYVLKETGVVYDQGQNYARMIINDVKYYCCFNNAYTNVVNKLIVAIDESTPSIMFGIYLVNSDSNPVQRIHKSEFQLLPATQFASKLELTGGPTYSLTNGQNSLFGNISGGSGIYISQNGIGLGNGNFVVDNQGHVTIVAKYDDTHTPYDYSLYDGDGYKRYIGGNRIQTYSVVMSGMAERLSSKDGAHEMYLICPGKYWNIWAEKYNNPNTTYEQKQLMYHEMVIDVTDSTNKVGGRSYQTFLGITAIEQGERIYSLYDNDIYMTAPCTGAMIRWECSFGYSAYISGGLNILNETMYIEPSVKCLVISTLDV